MKLPRTLQEDIALRGIHPLRTERSAEDKLCLAITEAFENGLTADAAERLAHHLTHGADKLRGHYREDVA